MRFLLTASTHSATYPRYDTTTTGVPRVHQGRGGPHLLVAQLTAAVGAATAGLGLVLGEVGTEKPDLLRELHHQGQVNVAEVDDCMRVHGTSLRL